MSRLPSPPARMIPKTFGVVGMAQPYAAIRPGTSVVDMRVDIVTKEYPPEIYGGAGVHVTELVRALRERMDAAVRVGAAFAEQDTTAYGVPAELQPGERRDPDARHRSGDRVGHRRRGRRAQPHLVRELRRPSRGPSARHPHIVTAHSPSPSAREGRATWVGATPFPATSRRRPTRARRRSWRSATACALTSWAALPRPRPGEGARDLQRHRCGRLAAGGESRTRGARDQPGPAVGRLRRPDHPAEGLVFISSGPRSSCRRMCRSSCARARRTPPDHGGGPGSRPPPAGDA